MRDSILSEASRVRRLRVENPKDVPESLPMEILKEAVRTIDVFLDHYRNGADGNDFRSVRRCDVKNIEKAKIDRQQIVADAADQLEWILDDDIPGNMGVTFREICDANNADYETVRRVIFESLFQGVHRNAFVLLKQYLSWKERVDANSYSEWSDHPSFGKLQAQY